MVRVATAIFAMAMVFSTARAAWKCRCEDNQYHVAGGINNACNDLSNDWDTRDCNIFGKNCDWCRYGPDGEYDRDSYDELKSWCGQQSYVSNNIGSRSYELECYRD